MPETDLIERLNSRIETWRHTGDKARVSVPLRELRAIRARLASCEAALARCGWYWPEDDTSSEMCGESAQEIVQNAYDWTPEHAGDIVAVARGGIVEVTYCASLPAADDADSDDDFWVEEQTHEAAKAKIEAEQARRAALTKGGEDA